jgi:hypothetical protein
MAKHILSLLVVALVAGATALPMQGQEQAKARVPVVLWHGAAPPKTREQSKTLDHMRCARMTEACLRPACLRAHAHTHISPHPHTPCRALE